MSAEARIPFRMNSDEFLSTDLPTWRRCELIDGHVLGMHSPCAEVDGQFLVEIHRLCKDGSWDVFVRPPEAGDDLSFLERDAPDRIIPGEFYGVP